MAINKAGLIKEIDRQVTLDGVASYEGANAIINLLGGDFAVGVGDDIATASYKMILLAIKHMAIENE